MPSRINAAHSIDDPILLSDEALTLAVGPLGIFVLGCRDRHHLAVITLAPQPAEKGAFEQLGVETVSLCSPMLARHRHTCGVNDVGVDAARLDQACDVKILLANLEPSTHGPFRRSRPRAIMSEVGG